MELEPKRNFFPIHPTSIQLTSVGHVLEFDDNHRFLFILQNQRTISSGFSKEKKENRTTGVFQKPQRTSGFLKEPGPIF
jgi:hypothetical protein